MVIGLMVLCEGYTEICVLFCSEDVFERHPDIKRVKSQYGVAHVRPYIGNVCEVVQNWRVKSRQG